MSSSVNSKSESSPGAMIKAAREYMNKRQNEVADAIGVTPGLLSKAEANQLSVSKTVAEVLCRYLNINFDAFWNATELRRNEESAKRQLARVSVPVSTSHRESASIRESDIMSGESSSGHQTDSEFIKLYRQDPGFQRMCDLIVSIWQNNTIRPLFVDLVDCFAKNRE